MKLFALLAALATLTAAVPANGPVRYDGQQIVRIPNTKSSYSAARSMHLDIIGQSSTGLDLRIPTSDKLSQVLSAAGISQSSVKVLDANLQASIDAEKQRLAAHSDTEASPRRKTPMERLATYFTDYHKYEEIRQFCQDLVAQYPKLVTFVPSIGKSRQGRDIFQIKITGHSKSQASKPRLWLHSMQHAREWISGATTQYIANFLVSNYGKDKRVTGLVDNNEWVITPVVNPDGYVHTWTKDRMWRKNMYVDPASGKVVGVDTNRNWPDHWGRDDGSSGDSSDQTFRGPAPASEPEVQAMIKALRATPNIVGAVDFHCFAEVLLRPWGWGDAVNADEAQYVGLANKMMKVISANTKRGSKYDSRPRLYPVSGSVRDFMYGSLTPVGGKKKYSITAELSPNESTGGNGFILPPANIVKVGDEWTQAIMTFAEHVTQNQLGLRAANEV